MTHVGGSDTAPTDIGQDVYDRRWKILGVLCTSLVVVIVGNTSLNVALPTIARDLGASLSQQQWMVDAYSLVFAGMLLTAGTLGDRYGRKGALQVGLVVFFCGSVFAAIVAESWAIIAGRAVMGLGAAFVMPGTLSILTNVFPPLERGRAIGIWAGISGAGAAIGPVVSGFLLEHFSWSSVFLVNVPIILFALLAGRVVLPKSRDPEPGPLDPLGAVLSIAGLGLLVYAIIEAPHNGWASAESLVLFAVAALLIVSFLVWERRNSAPMLDLHYFRDPRFGVAAGVITLVFFAMFGFFFLMTQYFQLVLGYSAFEAGVKQVPFAVMMVLVAPRAPQVARRIGTNRTVAIGLLGVATGMFLFTTVDTNTPYLAVLPVMIVMSSGMALTMPSMTTSIMSAVPMGKAGVGSAVNDTTRELGGALGVAVLGSVVASRFASKLEPVLDLLPTGLRGTASESLAGALAVAQQSDGPVATRVASYAREAYVSGIHIAGFIAGTVALIAAGVVYRRLPAGNPHAVAAVGPRPAVAEG